jgi:hypothetical protein
MHVICRSLYPTCTLQSETAGNISSVGFLSLLTSPFYISPGLNNIKSVFIVDALIQDLTWDQFLSLILTRFFSVFSNYEVSEKWRRNCSKLSVTSLKVIWVSDASAYLFLSTGYPFTLTLWRRSSSKCYLRIQSVPQREHHTSPLQKSTC